MQRLLGRFVHGQLVIDAPDIARLAVHQHGVAGVPGGIEKCQAFSRQIELYADVGNHEPPFIGRPFKLEPQQRAQSGAGAISGHHPISLQAIGIARGIDLQHRTVDALLDIDDFIAPTQFDQRLCLGSLHQMLLEVLLLQVGHRRKTIVLVDRGFHAKNSLAAVVRIAETPGQTLFGHHPGHPHLLENFHGTTGENNCAATFTDLLLSAQNSASDTVARQFERQRQANRSGTHNRNGRAIDDAWGRYESRINLIGKIQRLMGYDLRLMHGPAAPGLLLSETNFVFEPL
ncbi:hypothetical protein D3C84_492710 [compost metagenome]